MRGIFSYRRRSILSENLPQHIAHLLQSRIGLDTSEEVRDEVRLLFLGCGFELLEQTGDLFVIPSFLHFFKMSELQAFGFVTPLRIIGMGN